MAKGWNISFWVKNMEGQVFAKIFHCTPSPTVPFIIISKTGLTQNLLPQKAVLQTCYGRNFHPKHKKH